MGELGVGVAPVSQSIDHVYQLCALRLFKLFQILRWISRPCYAIDLNVQLLLNINLACSVLGQ